jgi:hypothetical protein
LYEKTKETKMYRNYFAIFIQIENDEIVEFKLLKEYSNYDSYSRCSGKWKKMIGCKTIKECKDYLAKWLEDNDYGKKSIKEILRNLEIFSSFDFEGKNGRPTFRLT